MVIKYTERLGDNQKMTDTIAFISHYGEFYKLSDGRPVVCDCKIPVQFGDGGEEYKRFYLGEATINGVKVTIEDMELFRPAKPLKKGMGCGLVLKAATTAETLDAIKNNTPAAKMLEGFKSGVVKCELRK